MSFENPLPLWPWQSWLSAPSLLGSKSQTAALILRNLSHIILFHCHFVGLSFHFPTVSLGSCCLQQCFVSFGHCSIWLRSFFAFSSHCLQLILQGCKTRIPTRTKSSALKASSPRVCEKFQTEFAVFFVFTVFAFNSELDHPVRIFLLTADSGFFLRRQCPAKMRIQLFVETGFTKFMNFWLT